MKILILYFVIRGLFTSAKENLFDKRLERKSIKASKVLASLTAINKIYIFDLGSVGTFYFKNVIL